MTEEVEFPGSHDELVELRLQMVEELSQLGQRSSSLRRSQPLEGTWDPHVKWQLSNIQREKKEREMRIARLNVQIKKLNFEAAERRNSDGSLDEGQREKLRQERHERQELFRQAKMQLVSSIVYDDPNAFLHRASQLLSSLAANFERHELTEEEWAVIKVFREIITQPKNGG